MNLQCVGMGEGMFEALAELIMLKKKGCIPKGCLLLV